MCDVSDFKLHSHESLWLTDRAKANSGRDSDAASTIHSPVLTMKPSSDSRFILAIVDENLVSGIGAMR